MLTITSASIDAVKIIKTKSFKDARGVFCETYNRNRFLNTALHSILCRIICRRPSRPGLFAVCTFKTILPRRIN